jgi:uncharacterized membrane protein
MSAVRALQNSPRRFSWPEMILLAFVAVQVMDGVMSYVGINRIGWIEGNPLVEWYALVLGPALAFTLVKLFAVACGAVLYLKARHAAVAALTVFYLAFAVVPWVSILAIYGNIAR